MFVPPRVRRGPHVTLKALGFEDVDPLFDALREDRTHIARATAWAETVHDRDAAWQVVSKVRDAFAQEREFHFAVFHHGRFVGCCGYYLDGPLRGGQTEIGGWLRRSEVGRGLASLAGEELVRWGFEEWGFRRIFAQLPADNPRARTLVQRLGLRHEGTLRAAWDPIGGRVVDLEIWALLADEWRQETSSPKNRLQ